MQFEKACKRLIIRDAFWGLLMLGLNKEHTTKVETLAVAKEGIDLKLLINDDFWNSLNDAEQIAILLHELHHICFGHILMSADFPDHEKFNLACDAEVNQYIEGLPPDDGHVDIKVLGLPEKQGAKWYYEHWPEKNQNSEGGSEGSGSSGMETIDDHSVWKEFERASEAQRELLKAQVDGIIKQAAEQTQKACGNIPSYLKEIIDDILKERPRVYNWRSQFRRMLGTEIDITLRRTHKRESKRFSDSPGIKFNRKISILVAIDTSGSVSDTELSEFFSEIMHIKRAGAKVTICEFDADIHSIWEFKKLQNIKITGRGGTNFRPPVDYYKAHKKDYTMFVMFTDGCADINNLDVPGNNMTWVISSSGSKQDYPGKVIYIPAKNKDV